MKRIPLLEKINAHSMNAYLDYRLKNMRYYTEQNRCVISLRYGGNKNDYRRIEQDILLFVPRGIEYEFEYEKITFDKGQAHELVRTFLQKNLPDASSIETIRIENETVEIPLKDYLYKLAIDLELDKALADSLDDELCVNYQVQFLSVDADKNDYEMLYLELEKDALSKDADISKEIEQASKQRRIAVSKIERFIGESFSSTAMYIKDTKAGFGEVVLCGKITKPEIRIGQKKSDPSKEYSLIKFDLTDFTGRIQCSLFGTKQSKPKYEKLEGGESIIARGRIEEGYNGGAHTFKPVDVCFCELPTSFTERIFKAKPPKEYRVVFPERMVVSEQSDFFSTNKKVHPSLKGEFIVLDLETTGINPSSDKITEIAAVRVVDGEIREKFESLINPGIPIPDEVVRLTGVTNEMVSDKPAWNEVAPDLAKFCGDSLLVGHNLPFDLSFLNTAAFECHYFFEQENVDTLQLARKKVSGLKSYKLTALADHFGIEFDGAHRALFDVLTTARLYMKLVQL